MTLGRLTLTAALSMLLTGGIVYALTLPDSAPSAPFTEFPTASASSLPQPHPIKSAPAPSGTPAAPGGSVPVPSGSASSPRLTSPLSVSVSGPSTAPTAGNTSTATRIDPTLAITLLSLFSRTEAPGMSPDGSVLAGNLRQGQSREQPIQLSPGKCYTALAVGIGVTEMDVWLELATQIPGMSPVLARDALTGASASLGGKGHCYKWSAPLATPAKLVMKATAGHGAAAAQLFVK